MLLKKFLLASCLLIPAQLVAAPPLTEPMVSVYVTKFRPLDGSTVCNLYQPELLATTSPSTRDRVMLEIHNDSVLSGLVTAAKEAAKNADVKKKVQEIETKRPGESAKVVFAVAKHEDNYGKVHYGLRVSYAWAHHLNQVLPATYALCHGPSRYDSTAKPHPFDGANLNHTGIGGDAYADRFKGVHALVTPEHVNVGTILERLQQILDGIPLDDGDLTSVGIPATNANQI